MTSQAIRPVGGEGAGDPEVVDLARALSGAAQLGDATSSAGIRSATAGTGSAVAPGSAKRAPCVAGDRDARRPGDVGEVGRTGERVGATLEEEHLVADVRLDPAPARQGQHEPLAPAGHDQAALTRRQGQDVQSSVLPSRPHGGRAPRRTRGGPQIRPGGASCSCATSVGSSGQTVTPQPAPSRGRCTGVLPHADRPRRARRRGPVPRGTGPLRATLWQNAARALPGRASGGDDLDADLGGDLGVQPHGHRVAPRVLIGEPARSALVDAPGHRRP